MPAFDLTLSRQSLGKGSWPEVLRQPLIKCTADRAVLSGYASGVRSALLHDARSDKWYRLKGCGNNSDGFPIVSVLDDAGQALHSDPADEPNGISQVLRKIRGACYLHTATLELHMS